MQNLFTTLGSENANKNGEQKRKSGKKQPFLTARSSRDPARKMRLAKQRLPHGFSSKFEFSEHVLLRFSFYLSYLFVLSFPPFLFFFVVPFICIYIQIYTYGPHGSKPGEGQRRHAALGAARQDHRRLARLVRFVIYVSHVCMSCMHICVCISRHTHPYTHRQCTHARTHARTRTHTHTHTRTHTHTHMHTHTHTHAHTHTHTHTGARARACAHKYP